MNINFRKLINDLHLWAGLGSGLVLFVVCLSGTIYTFRTEIDEWLNKEKFYFELDNKAQWDPDSLMGAVQKKENAIVASVTIPAKENKYWTVSLKPANPQKKGKELRGKQVLLNPYTAEVAPVPETGSGKFFLAMMKLHRWLLLEQKTGRVIVGTATLIFVFLLLTGIILWIPKKWRYWKQAFVILFSGKWKRLNHDLHNVLGFYTFLLLLVMGLTGLCWSFDWYRNGMSRLLGAPVLQRGGGKPVLSKTTSGTTVALASVINRGNQSFTQKGTIRIAMPEDSAGVFSFSKNHEDGFNVAKTDKVILDQYSGEILKVEKFSDKNRGEKIAASIKPLHTGEIYGWFSKIVYFICCLIATSLPVTGTIIWWNKLRKR